MADHRHLEWFPHQTTSLCGQTSLTLNFKRKPPRFEMAVAVNIMLISNDSVSKRYKCLISHNILTSGYYVTDSWVSKFLDRDRNFSRHRSRKMAWNLAINSFLQIWWKCVILMHKSNGTKHLHMVHLTSCRTIWGNLNATTSTDCILRVRLISWSFLWNRWLRFFVP